MTFRVLTVTNMYPCDDLPHYGTFVEEHVAALRREGIGVDVFFTNPRLGRHRYVSELPRLASTLRDRRYDVVHAHHTYSALQAIFARLIARYFAPLVFTIHEGELHADRRNVCTGDLLKRLVYLKAPKRLALNLSTAVVAVEPTLPAAAGYHGPFQVIPPAVDCDRFQPSDRLQARRLLGLPLEEPIVLFPASPRRPEKGWSFFEEVRTLLDPSIHVVIGGGISRADMPLYINAADVVVQTSQFEASPMIVKEAMACDTAIVSTDVGDVATLFGATPGYFCVPRDVRSFARAVEDALASPSSAHGRYRLLSLGLSPEAVARRYIAIYTSLIERRNRAL
jgi:glycosyltransferase involved in cell wall biosynthesis